MLYYCAGVQRQAVGAAHGGRAHQAAAAGVRAAARRARRLRARHTTHQQGRRPVQVSTTVPKHCTNCFQ